MVFLVSLFSYSLVWFKLLCDVCCARAGLVKQHDCGIECSCFSQYVGRGNSICFGLPGFSFLSGLVRLFDPGLLCLIVSVCAGLAGFVLSWFGRLGRPGQT